MNKLVFTLPMMVSCYGDHIIQQDVVYVVDIIETESDGCNNSQLLSEYWWLNELNIQFTRNEYWLDGVATTEDEFNELFGCETNELSFWCEIFEEDDYFRADEGFSAIMRESVLIEGEWIGAYAIEGTLRWSLECIGNDCDEAIANAWEIDGEFDYPQDLPCESVFKFEGIAPQ